MKILCTGISGYVGSKLCLELLKQNHSVKGVDLQSMPYNRSEVDFILGDIRNGQLMDSVLNGVDAVVHLAAVVPPHPYLEPQMEVINFQGTCCLAQLCRVKGISRFLTASTCSVYGLGENLTENDKPKLGITAHAPDTPYVSSKIKAETFVLSLKKNGFNPTVLRFATAFGASPRTGWQSLFNTFVKEAANSKRLEVKHPNSYRPFCHVEDIVRGICLILQQPVETVSGQIFNVGGVNATKYELCGIIKKYIPDYQFVSLKGMDLGYSVNFGKIYNLGFKLTKTMDDGVIELIEVLNGIKVLRQQQGATLYQGIRS